MPQLIAAIIVIYLYFLLIAFLFKFVGPIVFTLTVILVLVSVLVVFGRSFFRVYGKKGWQSLFLVPVVMLLCLMLFDFSFVFLMGVAEYELLRELTVPSVARLMQDAFGNAVNFTIFKLFGAFGLFSSKIEYLGILAIMLKTWFLVPFGILSRGLYNEIRDSDGEPAYVQYFFQQSFNDLQELFKGTFTEGFKWIKIIALGIFVIVAGPHALFTWPIFLCCVVALVPPLIIGIGFLILLFLTFAFSFFSIILVILYFALMLYLMERFVMFIRSGYAKCPHAGCHEPVASPIFSCPACGARHKKLIPNRFGMLNHVCQCGGAFLPTLFWNGKGKMPSYCPKCGQPMIEQLFGGNAHIPIYAGPSSGKTMFMIASTWQVLEGKLPSLRGKLLKETEARNYNSYWRADFESGRLMEKTMARLPDAYLLYLKRTGGLPISLYLYDPAGEALLSQSDLEGHRFIRYFDGMCLLLDPLSFPSFAERYYSSVNAPDLTSTTSKDDPKDIVNRIINLLEDMAKFSRKKSISKRVAVILTKGDIPTLAEETQVALADSRQGLWRKLRKSTESDMVREWLLRNDQALVQMLETRFKEVRYYMVSALGHLPQSGRGFDPKMVWSPLAWILSKRATLRHPKLARMLASFGDFVAIMTVLSVFVGMPVGLLLFLIIK